jgi:hypothetical protein
MTIPAAIHTLLAQLETVLLAAEATLDEADAIGLEPSEAAEDAMRYAWTGYYQFVAICTGEPRERT